VIDLRELRDNPERAREAQRRRGASPELVDEILAVDELRRTSIASFERLRAEQKALGRQIATADAAEKTDLLVRTRELSASVVEAIGPAVHRARAAGVTAMAGERA
jgi:seryl-tRNA synthetase